MSYVRFKNGAPVSHTQNPKWRDDAGNIITDDAVYIAGGIPDPVTGVVENPTPFYPVVGNGARHDPARQHATRNPVEQWVVHDGSHVEVTYTITDKTLAEVQADKVREIERKHTDTLNGGFPYDFGTKTATLPDGATEPAGIRTIQTRSADRERWQATMQVAQQYIMAGLPTEPMRAFRTADNARVPMTAQGVADCLNAMQAHFGLALDALWTHKDAVRALTTVDAVIAYDHTTGWD